MQSRRIRLHGQTLYLITYAPDDPQIPWVLRVDLYLLPYVTDVDRDGAVVYDSVKLLGSFLLTILGRYLPA